MSKLAARLADASRSGVYRIGSAEALEQEAPGAVRIALAGGKKDMLDAIAGSLAFPSWFGGNWDALEDCLSALKGARHVLLFTGAQAVDADDLGILIDVLDSAATFHGAQDRPFFAVFLDPQRTLGLPELHREK
jgi:hypothetical protein